MLPSLHRLRQQPTTTTTTDMMPASPSSISAREAEKGVPKPVRDVLLPAGVLREELPNDIKEMIRQLIEGMPVDLCRSGLQRACANAMRQPVPNEDLQRACDAEFHALCQTGIDDPNNVYQVARPYLCNLVLDAQGAWVTGPGGDYNPYDMTGWNEAEAMYRWVRQFGLFCAIEHARINVVDMLQRRRALRTLRAFGNSQLYHIPDDAFRNFPALDIDKLPDSILEIGNRAFMFCRGIWRMRLPDGLLRIRSGAFSDCTNLRRINLPDSLTRIEPHAFHNCRSLKEIALPPNIDIIDDGVFMGCTNLETVTLSPQTQQIKMGAFADCTALRRVELPDSMRFLQYNQGFYNCHPDLVLVYEDREYPANDQYGVYPQVMRQRE